MKRRYLYSLLFAIPGLILSEMVTLLLFALTAGMLWLFVFGDNPWPAYVGTLVPVLFGLIFIALWVATIIVGYRVGKWYEKDPAVNKLHVLISAVITVLLLLVVGFDQVGHGRIGPKTTETLCSEFCVVKGYSASSVSPRISADRNCSCLDTNGAEIIQVPVETLDGGR